MKTKIMPTFVVVAILYTPNLLALDKAAACLDMAAYAKRFFQTLQYVISKDPTNKDVYVEALRKRNFDQYKKNVEKDGEIAALAWDTQRLWGEIGINEYLRTSDVTPDVAERNIYDKCMSSRGK